MILHSHSWAYTQCMLSHFSHVQLFVTLWTVTHQAPLSMRFSRQEYWMGYPFNNSKRYMHSNVHCSTI